MPDYVTSFKHKKTHIYPVKKTHWIMQTIWWTLKASVGRKHAPLRIKSTSTHWIQQLLSVYHGWSLGFEQSCIGNLAQYDEHVQVTGSQYWLIKYNWQRRKPGIKPQTVELQVFGNTHFNSKSLTSLIIIWQRFVKILHFNYPPKNCLWYGKALVSSFEKTE